MHISAKIEYACLALLELAVRHDLNEPLPIKTIAARHGAPSGFLVQILLQLKAAGLVTSTRGAAGGYRLAQPPEEITLLDAMNAIDPPPATVTSNATVKNGATQTLLRVWNEVADKEREMLAGVTFAELAAEAQSSPEMMYYI